MMLASNSSRLACRALGKSKGVTADASSHSSKMLKNRCSRGGESVESSFSTMTKRAAAHYSNNNAQSTLLLATTVSAAALGVATTLSLHSSSNSNHQYGYSKTHCAAAPPPPIGGELIQTGTPVKEPSTGILFPQLCNGMYLAGCGVRIKWGFIKVYAVGTYMDPLAMSAVKKASSSTIEQALLDPTYPRTIRIVMARDLSIDKFTSAIVEALEPRMKGRDLEKLEEFKQMNPLVNLIKGAEIEMTIRGDTLLYKNAMGGVGTIRSEVFTRAMCDVYFGADPVSPAHKDEVIAGIPKL